ncbi:MAG: hypothetical protein F6K19_15610 [Cyanothece sp. SIO1E1]|nr:hypothetical protein [Cyanothece sp. SIO1E1]
MKDKRILLILFLFTILFWSVNGCVDKNHPQKSSIESSFLSQELLNSERIEMKFGSYGIEVIKSDSALRVSNLFSLHDNKKVTRTFAVVNYPEIVDSVFLNEHLLVLDGQSIGSVFKQSGWEIEKRNLFFGEISPSIDYSGVYKLMGDIDPTELAVYIYVFSISKDEQSFDYAIISEVYHHDYLTLNDLKKINQDANEYLDETSVTQVLGLVKNEMKLSY